jgi:hypothetical protein
MIPPALRRATGALLAATLLVLPTHAYAGLPLICHPYDIANAKTLPPDPRVDPASTYDRSKLVADTLALLKVDTPILVRMETLRRAAIFATRNLDGVFAGGAYTAADRELAGALIAQLRDRTLVAEATAQALAQFDLGFLAATLRPAAFDPGLDGYALLVTAGATLKDDPAVEFALALASIHPTLPGHAGHLAKARALARPGSLVAANLASHFGKI